MHFATLPLLALAAMSYAAEDAKAGPMVTVYSDSECKNLVQTIHFTHADVFQCAEFTNLKSQSAIIHPQGLGDHRGYNVWDAQYCAGDMAGGLPYQLGTCLSASYFGLAAFKSAHISPRNSTGQGIKGGVLPVPTPSSLPNPGLPV